MSAWPFCWTFSQAYFAARAELRRQLGERLASDRHPGDPPTLAQLGDALHALTHEPVIVGWDRAAPVGDRAVLFSDRWSPEAVDEMRRLILGLAPSPSSSYTSNARPAKPPLRDRLIYEARIGVDGNVPRTYRSIAAEYGLSPERVRQIAVREWTRQGEPGHRVFRRIHGRRRP